MFNNLKIKYMKWCCHHSFVLDFISMFIMICCYVYTASMIIIMDVNINNALNVLIRSLLIWISCMVFVFYISVYPLTYCEVPTYNKCKSAIDYK